MGAAVFTAAVWLSTLLCSLVAGFLFAFAVVVMPGIRRLPDRSFLETFRAIDGVIQARAPLFMLMWVGSVVALLAALALGFAVLDGADLALLAAAAALYLVGVQLPTGLINIPLNNRIQACDLETMTPEQLRAARHAFESRWNGWNIVRTAAASLTATLLFGLLLRI